MKMKQREDVFSALCRARKWKCTIQRRTVFNFIAGNTGHPSVEDVCTAVRKTIPNISMDSIYRILNDFSTSGFLLRLEGCGRSHFDPNTSEHDHFYCVRCGRVYDIPGTAHSVSKEQFASLGEVDFCEIRVTGTCKNCLPQKKSTDK